MIEKSGEEHEKKYAGKVLRLLKRGKHWVLVTLLLGNVITNETLPIVLDRSLGGGWPAVLGSTVLIGNSEKIKYFDSCDTNFEQSSSAKSSPSPYAFAMDYRLAHGCHLWSWC